MPKRKRCDDESDDEIYRELKRLKKKLRRRSKRKSKKSMETSRSRSSTPIRSNSQGQYKVYILLPSIPRYCFHTPSITEKRTVRGKPEGLSISSEQLDFYLQKLPTFPLSYKANRTRTVRGKPWGLSNLYCSSNSNAVVHFRS